MESIMTVSEHRIDLAGRLRLIADTLVQSARKQTPKATQVA